MSGDDLKHWVNERVGARYQKLADVLVLDSCPRNVAGKTLRREIRKTYLRQTEKA